MANQRREAVSYRQFRATPLLAEGLLGVQRDDGMLERKVAEGLARASDYFGQKADRQAAIAGEQQGRADAFAAAPGAATVSGGEQTTASVNGQAGHVAGAQGGVRVYIPPEQLKNVIADAAVRHAVDPHTLTQIAGIESKFNPSAKNPNSSAGGLFQFVDGTARQYGLRDRFDPAQAADAAARLASDNTGALKSALGRMPTAGELYLAHQQGAAGATKLLKNPSARAVDLVGADAVKLNGGNTNMTAGEFAAIWTSKVSNGSSSAAASDSSYQQIPASSVGPVSVTPVDRPVVTTPGAPGGFRPTGRDTVYGRAYDVAGTKTYLQELELTMMQDQQAVFDAYKDDPAKLQKSLGELEQAHMKDHVFDEIAPEYANAFRRRAFGLVEQAKGEFEQKRKAQDRVDFIGRVQTMENAKSQQLAGLDVNSDTAAASLAQLQGTIDNHYDTAVARGIMTPAEAANAKENSRSDTLTGFYAKQAAGKSAPEIAKMRKDMTADYAAGKLEGVNAADWTRIDSGLAAAEKARATQDVKADADLTKRGEDLAKRVARGMPVTPDELARFQLDASTAPNGSKIVSSTLTRLKVSEAIRTLPIGEVEQKLKSLLGDKATADDLDFARKSIADHRRDLKADPIGVAERFGILPVSEGLPLDQGADPDAVSAAFAERINQADAAANHFGVSPRYFRPGEAEQIDAAVTADPERGIAIAAGLVDAAGRNAPQVLRQLGETAPAVSGAGEIMAMGGDPKAARDLLAGYGKTPDGKAYTDIKVTKRKPEAAKIAGDALVFSPDQMNSLDQQAAAIARKRLYDAGIDPKSDDAKPIYSQAFQEAAGASFVGQVQYGGFADYDPGTWWKERKVVVPPSIRADHFEDVIRALDDGDFPAVKAKSGKAWSAADFKKAMPVAIDGGYVFALGDPSGSSPMFIADENGNPVVLDIAGMDGLKKRVPEAFR